jgi:hypothetical protein
MTSFHFAYRSPVAWKRTEKKKRRKRKGANKKADITTPTFHLSDCFYSAFSKFNCVCFSFSFRSLDSP